MRKYADGYAPAEGMLEEKLKEISSGNIEIPKYVINNHIPLIDSSNMNIDTMNRIGRDIYANYDKYDGFIVLHGTDTMAYTATALSFMFANLSKPIIFTGAQEPIGGIKSDSESNILNSLYFAANFSNVFESTICFGGKLLRGNRALAKTPTRNYDTFLTPNYPVLHEITDKPDLVAPKKRPSVGFCELNTKCNIDVMYLFPGFSRELLQKKLSLVDALVIVSYGLGNAPTDKSFLEILSQASHEGKILVSCSQCLHNLARPSVYEAGKKFEQAGVINLYDMTIAAAIFKLIYLTSARLSAKRNSNKDYKKIYVGN